MERGGAGRGGVDRATMSQDALPACRWDTQCRIAKRTPVFAKSAIISKRIHPRAIPHACQTFNANIIGQVPRPRRRVITMGDDADTIVTPGGKHC